MRGGVGRSHPYDDTAAHLDRMTGDAFAVLDALGIDKASLICQSMGGWTGLRMALQAPERVSCFVGVSSPMGIAYPSAVEDAMQFIASLAESGLGIEDAALSATFRNNKPSEF